MYPQTHTQRYNRLTDVELADVQLSALNKVEILGKLSEVIRNYGLEDCIGIRLLHRHNRLTDGEIMLETEDSHHPGDAALTTMARSLSGIKHPFAPHSWMAEDGRYFPLEYSEDPAVAGRPDFVEQNVLFFEEFEAVLARYGASGLLGPCILRRFFFDAHQPASPAILIETSDEVRRANTVRFAEEGHYDWKNMIQTTWTAIDPAKYARQSASDGGHAALLAMACVPVTGCIRVGDGGHTPVTGHQ